MSSDGSSVRVAIRIRPQLPREILDMYRICTTVTPGEPQITIGKEKAFTYDYVFDTEVDQQTIYDTCAKSLVTGSLEGYNATVLAYGQTGSGKTYTMGTGFDVDVNSDLMGIIPRAIHELFSGINRVTDEFVGRGQAPPQFKVTAQFLELYNEEIIDLFESAREYTKGKKTIKIHEDSNRCIYLTGVRSEKVSSPEEALMWLKQGALARRTASTCMNSQSSRSHAIFTLHVRQQRVVSVESCEGEENENGENDVETLSAKFHFVDLAGSERLKRTGATGDRAKEGISINCGLLALGNVISALGDLSKRALHVPYRDSKLTRLLQDSLGGNSRTLMIACISPSDRDFMETLNTLNYANRARNIQNKVVINQDKSSRTISLLKKQIQELQLELAEYKQGKRVVGDDGVEAVNDMFHENKLLQTELDNLRTRLKALQQTVDLLNSRNVELLSERAVACINQDSDNKNDDMSQLIKGYLTEIEKLRAKLVESESVCGELRKAVSRNRAIAHRTIEDDDNVEGVIDLANKEIEREMSLLMSRKKAKDHSDNSGDSSSESEGEDDDSEENSKNEYSAELAVLTSEISIKQQLLDALEKNQKRLHNMKTHYEEKLVLLQEKIQATVKERDSVLASYCKENNQPIDKINKVKEDYEKRLAAMQREMKSLQTAKREHAKLLRNQSQYESQIRVLSNEVSEMKRTKVKLMNKMKEESQRHKEAENRRNREISQLKKQTRIDANTIKKMEEEKRAKTIVLKRKQEEVAALRMAANRKTLHKKNMGRSAASPKEVKRKWVFLEKRIAEITLNKQSISALEREMVKKMESRVELLEELKQKTDALKDPLNKDSTLLKEEVESLQANLDHVQSAISELQNEIVQVEENKGTFETEDIQSILTNPLEAPYIIGKLYDMALHQSCLAAQTEFTNKELAVENEQLKKDSEMQEQLLRHLVENQDKERRIASSEGDSSPEHSPRSVSPFDIANMSQIPRRVNGKQRKKMMAPQDLLFQNDNPTRSNISGLISSYHGGQSLSAATSPEHRPASANNQAPFPLTRSLTTIKVQSVPASPVTLRRGLTLSPRINRKTYIISSNHPSMEEGLDKSPPGSPQPYRRQTSREENVFSRLTSQQSTLVPTSRKPGKITAYPAKKTKQDLQCSHVIEGHSRAVLALHATDENLFTGSQDQTVIMWDLNEMREARVFGPFKNSVTHVKYDPSSSLLFCVYSFYIELCDVRTSKPVHILNAFGTKVQSPASMCQSSNTESSSSPPNAIAINDDGTCLYTAADRVRAWDLRKLAVFTKFIGHKAPIKCIEVSCRPNCNDVVVTGAKDHYIRVFDVGNTQSNWVFPRSELKPPHYDGIQCLAIQGQTLFSGSRDCHIKKWKLDTAEHIMSVNSAHRNWVTGLCFSPDGSMLVSGSRDGVLKLWSADTCTNLAQVQAHDASINALASNSSHIFSASGDATCHLWKINSQLAV